MKQTMMKVLLALLIVFAAVAVSAQVIDVSLYDDDDRTNDPNLCHYTDVCKDEHDWTWGWHALRKAFGLPYSRAHVRDGDSEIISRLNLRRANPRSPNLKSPDPKSSECDDPIWYRKCVNAYPGDLVCDDEGRCDRHTLEGWKRGCWVGYCGCS